MRLFAHPTKTWEIRLVGDFGRLIRSKFSYPPANLPMNLYLVGTELTNGRHLFNDMYVQQGNLDIRPPYFLSRPCTPRHIFPPLPDLALGPLEYPGR